VIRLLDQLEVPTVFFGYITLDEVNQRSHFYYFVESEVDAASKPIVLWLNEGK
jgi:serine carboxypeptidase-like clade II